MGGLRKKEVIMSAAYTRPVSAVVGEVVADVREIVRSEVRLARAEIREEASKAASAAKLTGIAALLAWFAVGLILAAAAAALTYVMPAWAALLCVAAVCLIPAAFLFAAGRKQFQRVQIKPEKTIETVKENLTWNRNRNE
jgi:uncharacterized membrane protein YqjE